MKLINVIKSITESSPDAEPDEPVHNAFEAAQAAMDRAIEERRKALTDRRKEDRGPPPGMPERRSGLDRRDGTSDRRMASGERRKTESALLNEGIAERRSGLERRNTPPPAFGKRGTTT